MGEIFSEKFISLVGYAGDYQRVSLDLKNGKVSGLSSGEAINQARNYDLFPWPYKGPYLIVLTHPRAYLRQRLNLLPRQKR